MTKRCEHLDVWRSSGGPDRDYATAGRVVAPTLIQWGASGPVLPAELLCEIAAAFTSTSPQVMRSTRLPMACPEVQHAAFNGQGEQAILLARRQLNDGSVVDGE